jgi:hypothetical protein
MRGTSRAGYAYVAIGIAFMGIGLNGRRAFLAIGAAFFVIGIIAIRRSRTL